MLKTYTHQIVKEADTTLNNILALIVEGVWDWNGNTGHVTRSPGWYKMLGHDFDIFERNVFTWENIIHPDDYPRVMQHFEQYIKGEIKEYFIEYRCNTASGQYLWIVDRGQVVKKNPDGSVARMIGAHQNIHQYKIAQEKLLKQNKILQ